LEAANRVAKNTGILYIRMAITVLISLYSTRLILAALGLADFGLFNVVGGVISMLGFLNSSMAAATQRFMSFAQGAGDLEKVKRIFNMSSLLHWGIAVLVLFLLEGAGYFFFHGVLNIAPERMEVAKLIYQFMVISTLFTVISVPYEAVITSHENMIVFAVMGIIEAVLKLVIAFYITYTCLDHLVMYGVLMAALSLFLLFLKRIYCHRVYEECHLHVKRYYDEPLLKEMGGFAGWSLLGSSSSMFSAYGQGLVLNIFFGTIVNAAQGIANQVSGQLGVFAGTMQKALNPMIDKSEGSGNRQLMLKASMTGSKISFFLLMITFIPVLIEMQFIFNTWLENIPENTILFCRLLLIKNLFEQSYITLSSTIAAVGQIKKFQIISSTINFFPLGISYLLFFQGAPPHYLYIVFLIYSIFQAVIVIHQSKVVCELPVIYYLKDVVFRCWFVFLIVFSFSLIPYYLLESNSFRLGIVALISLISSVFLIGLFGGAKEEKIKFKNIINSYSKNHKLNRLNLF
jgi:O-antigen/teichoic acid export membrane protein